MRKFSNYVRTGALGGSAVGALVGLGAAAAFPLAAPLIVVGAVSGGLLGGSLGLVAAAGRRDWGTTWRQRQAAYRNDDADRARAPVWRQQLELYRDEERSANPAAEQEAPTSDRAATKYRDLVDQSRQAPTLAR